MARKRSASNSTARSKKRKSRKSSQTDASCDSPPPPFLALPAELRSYIYALGCLDEDEKTYLGFRSRGNLAHAGSWLPRVSKQVRDEFLPILSSTVPTINAQVRDFDFAHIVTLPNRCDKTEPKKLSTIDATEGNEFDFGPVIYLFNRCERLNLVTLPSSITNDISTRTMTIEIEPTVNSHYFTDRL